MTAQPPQQRTLMAGATAMVIGGVTAAAVFVPFTITHGPTSVNLERTVAGWDMHQWGALMGTIPPLLVAAGLWSQRTLISGGRRSAYYALTVMCAAMFLFAAMNAGWRGLGPPFDLFVLAPASVIAAATAGAGAIPVVLRLLAGAYCVSLAVALIPLETSDSFGGYRVFGLIAYAAVGVLWASLGVALLVTHQTRALPADHG